MSELERINQSRLHNTQEWFKRDREKVRSKYIRSLEYEKLEILNALEERISAMYRDYYDYVALPYT